MNRSATTDTICNLMEWPTDVHLLSVMHKYNMDGKV